MFLRVLLFTLLSWLASAAKLTAETNTPVPARSQPLTPAEQKRFESGELVYQMTCIACHQQHGMGLEGLAPPLAGSEWVIGPEQRLIRIILNGMRGRVAVKEHDWDMDMPPLSILEDEQIASVLTYVRLDWNNRAAPVEPMTVKKIREATATRAEPWTAADLTNAVPSASSAGANAQKALPPIITPTAKSLPAILRGPYLQSGTTNSMVIRWRTDIPSPSWVRYGFSFTNLNKKASSTGDLTEHVVLLSGLKPDTKYYYSIGAPDCPILAALTNNMLFVRATNSSLAVSTSHRRQLANVTNATLILSGQTDELLITNPKSGQAIDSSNTVLVVSTTNNTLLVTWTNQTLAATTTNHTKAIRPPPGARPSRPGFGNFLVLNTNVTGVGGDTNTFFFTSPPIGNRQPVRIWVLGDPGTRKAEQKKVRDAYFKYTGNQNPDLWLMLGDNAYMAGTDAEYQGSVFQMYEHLLRTCVLWPTLGNHDAGSANSPTQSGVYYDVFTLPTQGQAGGVMSGTEAYYSFDYANVHLVCLDSSNSDRSTNGLMLKWLKADLAANRQDWCIAYFHHPPYTKGSHDSDNEKENDGLMRELRTLFVPAMEEGGVDLVLTGHSHAYERSFLLDRHYGRSSTLEDDQNIKSNNDGREDGWGAYHKATPGPAPHEGTVYVVAGSSGQVSSGGLLHPAMYCGLNLLGSVVLDFKGLRLDTRFLDANGLVRDYFTILKAAPDAGLVEPTQEKLVLAGNINIPERLAPLLQKNGSAADRAAAANARPSDQDVLLQLYQEAAELPQKAMLTWALAYIGNAEVATNFMRLLTNQFKGKEISLEQEDVCLETIKALGFLATRYEAVYDFLRKNTNPTHWQTNGFWFSPRGYQSAGLVAASSLRALGLSGRPEALEILAGVRKKGLEYKIKEYPDYARNFSVDLAKASSDYELFQKLGARAFQKQVLASNPGLNKLD